MILSMIGRCAILIHLSSVATFHGVSFNDKNQPYRNLQVYDCAQHNKRNQCPRDQNCLWRGGSCVAGPTSQPSTAGPTKSPVTLAPTNEPTNEPTPPPTSPPTNSPTVPGIGFCSQDPATNCWNVSECACAVGGGTAPAPAGEAGSSGNLFGGHRAHRALQNCSAANKKKDCVGLCAWVGGTCISATDEPTPSPVTSQPTTKPTNSPSLSPITGQPTRAPTPCACLGLGPTKSPTSEPTASPSLKPTNSPTEEPTPVPTNSPTKTPTPAPTDSPTNPKPTGAPTNGPTNAPTNAPTPALTNVPTDALTPAPTNAPTNQPSDAPTLVQAVTCPPAGSPMVTITSGLKTVAAAAADTFCGIFRRMQSGDLIPLARSYHGEDWESAPGPFASPTEDVTATSILLPDLAEPSDSYVILSKNGVMEDRKKIAKFLEMTTFGPRMSEIDTLDDTLWASDPVERRAQYVRDQMDLPATSHREYWRQRTNSKWDATAQPARSSHPCSPNSKWRKYSFTRQDRYHTITSEYIRTTFETVPEEANFNYTIYEADSASNVSAYGTGSFRDSSSTSGTGYYDFGGTGDFLEFSIAVVEAGMYPVSFRYALSSSSWNGQRPCQLLVNDVIIESVYAFQNTDSWSYWMYSELVDVALNSGINTIKLLAADQNGGPNIDHMRIGKPPAVVIKTNGWPRAIAKNGLQLLEVWPFNYTSESVLFVYYPEAPQGDLYRYEYGRIRILLSDGRQRFLDIGNAPVDFTGYEQYLPPNVFNFALSNIFEETATDLDTYPIKKGQELLLVNGSTDPVCDSVPPFAEEGDAPILGKLPNGEWIVWSPTILFEDNGPSVNAAAQDMTANVLSDGGGSTFIQTGEKLKCANVQRSFINEDTCFLSTESTACSATQPVGEVLVPMNASSMTAFYDLAGKYVYAIRGLAMETLAEHACTRASSRWEVNLDALCSAPTQLEAGTIVALEDAITSSSSSNEFIRDVSRKIACDTIDETVEKINIQIQVGNHCYTHVHPNHLNVYDFSGWVTKHPGGEYNIEKWAEGWEGNEGWYLDYPFVGNITREIPEHPMSRWYNRAAPPDVVFVSKFGDSIAFRDLPNDLKGDAVAQFFGAVPTSVTEGGIVVCGSVGEVSNNPALPETFDVRSDEHTTSSSDLFNNQKQVVWTEIALYGDDQLRQRMAWALAQIVTTVPSNINAYDRTEIYTKYYDIFVSNAFGNYRDILVEASYSPLMAEHLSYLRSKSHSYVYEDEDKRISRADENYAREVMQLFSIGLIQLNDDGTPVLDPLTGNPLETYTNEDIESFARAWTGFDRVSVRGNYEESSRGSTDNRLDPMGITPDWRDPFPKPHLNGGFIGDAYPLCKDLPAKSFLKKGAGYRLLGGKSSPELMKDPSYFDSTTPNFILRVELDPVSSLYQRLHNGGNPEIFVKLENDLVCTTGTVECDIDTVRVVKVGSIFYEFVEQPCVQMAFYENGKQIQLRDNYRRGQMCANTDLAHAREACCREDRVSEVRTAKMESGVTYLYEGERMTYDTARDRCVTYGRDLCLYERISITPNDDYRRKGYHWTNRDCGINVKVNSEGYIAIVHDAISSYINTVPYLVEEENTLNWFRVFWNGGSYPGDSETNTCEDNGCKILNDGHCLCKTTVTDSVVFTDIVGVTKENIMSQLFMGALGPQDSSTEIIITDELKVYTVGDNVDGNTIFKVKDNGRTLYMKNMLSTVGLEGWTMAPQIYKAEYATISNALVKNNTRSATGGEYVEFYNSDDTSFVEWSVIIPSAGKYAISLRFANDESPRPLSVSVNTQEITRTLEDKFYNSTKQLNNIGGNPPTDPPLERCDGDCDGDSDCTVGLFCLQLNSMESVPGCTGTKNSGWDYCVDIGYFDYGFTLLPTGGWTDDWQISKPFEVDLVAGENTIRVQMPPLYTRGPNIDHLKIEGLPTSTPQSSFRNPPHFMGLIPDYYPGGLGEQNLRDAQYETDAVLDHYFYHANVAPFMCVRIMQRFSFSNPSPRFVASCVESFRTGLYNSGSKTFGSGEYGSLEAMAASIVLDKEATEGAISSDPSYGGIQEPMLKVVHLMRSMDYQTSIPTILDGAPMQTTYNVRLWKIDEKIGHGPYEFPTVFSYFLPEYVADSGPTQKANLASPESMVVTMPNIVNLLNGMFSIIKYGLSDCYSGFSTYPGYSGCYDDGLYRRSYGHLFYEPTGVGDYEKATNLALLLTAGRLSTENLNIIVESCSSEPDEQSKNRCMQQLIVTTGEFHTNNFVTQSGEDRETGIGGGNTTEPYKAIVYFYLGGGLDSYNMLAPHTCAPIDVYARYRSIRGRSAIAEGVGLPLDRLLKIQANNPDQPCTSFGIHENLPALKQLYDNGQLNFIANAGLMAKPVTVDNYRGETPVQLFAHNAMTLEAKREDLTDKFIGTGVCGRMADVLTQAEIPTNLFSIDGQQVLLNGEAGYGPSPFILSSNGLSSFNSAPSIANMESVIIALNNGTTADSGFYAETWSFKLSESLAKQELLKEAIDATVVNTNFPGGSTSNEFEMVTRIMQTREDRGSKRDIFFVEDGGYDTHSNVDANLINRFSNINGVIQAFVDELVHLGLWESTVVLQFSEFARTLDPNTGEGTDHAWGGQHFMFGGSVKGGHVLGRYPSDFEQGDAERLALSRGRMVPTTPWDAMWKGTAEWFGIPATGPEMDKVLPMHKNFPQNILYNETSLFRDPDDLSAPTAAPVPTQSPTSSAAPTSPTGALFP